MELGRPKVVVAAVEADKDVVVRTRQYEGIILLIPESLQRFFLGTGQIQLEPWPECYIAATYFHTLPLIKRKDSDFGIT